MGTEENCVRPPNVMRSLTAVSVVMGRVSTSPKPASPGVVRALPFLDAYRKADYVTARTFILKAEMPGQFFSQSLLAAVYGQLGERAAAEDSVR